VDLVRELGALKFENLYFASVSGRTLVYKGDGAPRKCCRPSTTT